MRQVYIVVRGARLAVAPRWYRDNRQARIVAPAEARGKRLPGDEQHQRGRLAPINVRPW
jgi:hypothetical protein